MPSVACCMCPAGCTRCAASEALLDNALEVLAALWEGLEGSAIGLQSPTDPNLELYIDHLSGLPTGTSSNFKEFECHGVLISYTCLDSQACLQNTYIRLYSCPCSQVSLLGWSRPECCRACSVPSGGSPMPRPLYRSSYSEGRIPACDTTPMGIQY